ncbi:hypothetical protein G7Y79_00039g076060 [Physcia stellaris]|nr:hypothetical protein G7Y79_00039g076060 [Physcia stellaris]
MMQPNILITGAAGYIGGSLVTDFLSSSSALFTKEQIHAAVRSEAQAQALSKLGINVLRLDLGDEESVVGSLRAHDINIVIHTASSIEPKFALHLITALGKRKISSGQETYFVHTSALSAFYEQTGWPRGEFADNGPVFNVEKQLADSYPVRKTDVAIIEHAEIRGVTSFVVIPSLVYGKGTGEWNRLSVVIPPYVASSIASKKVYKFAENTKVSGVHISDLTALYGQIVQKILQQEALPSGKEGYYFALAHDLYSWEYLDHLAVTLHARGLVSEPKTELWASDEAAAKSLGVPVQFLQTLWNSGENITAKKPSEIGWSPEWTKDRFLQNIDDEIQAVLEEDQTKSSLIDSLFQAAKA